jgi:hypothetical protein
VLAKRGPPIGLASTFELGCVERSDDVSGEAKVVLEHECQAGLEGQVRTGPHVPRQVVVDIEVASIGTGVARTYADVIDGPAIIRSGLPYHHSGRLTMQRMLQRHRACEYE